VKQRLLRRRINLWSLSTFLTLSCIFPACTHTEGDGAQEEVVEEGATAEGVDEAEELSAAEGSHTETSSDMTGENPGELTDNQAPAAEEKTISVETENKTEDVAKDEAAETDEVAQNTATAEEEEEAATTDNTVQTGETTSADSVSPINASTSAGGSTGSKLSLRSRSRPEQRMFGKYKLQIAMNRPKFDDSAKSYETFYGKPQDYFTIGTDYFPWDFYITPGIGFRAGMYSASGRPVKGAVDRDTPEENLQKDENSDLRLLLIPVQVAAKIQMSPFSRKWLVLDGWIGYEHMWWQESRAPKSSIMLPIMAQDDCGNEVTEGSDTSCSYTNSGQKSSTTFGASAHILLNGLDEKSIRSMEATMGFGYVYLSPYFEVIKPVSSGLNFGRTVIGLGFTFESVR
jgi:hypothetical protein